MIISLIAAMANNRVIGKNNDMPWHMPADLAHFKQITLGKPVIMGRKTYESIGRPLPGRQNIVITRNTDLTLEGVTVVAGPEQALAAAGPVDEVMVIGGGHIYQIFLPMAHRLYLTQIELDVEGDTYFPDYAQVANWRQIDVINGVADQKNANNYKFLTLERAQE